MLQPLVNSIGGRAKCATSRSRWDLQHAGDFRVRNSSTSRNQTAWRNASGSASTAACSSGFIERLSTRRRLRRLDLAEPLAVGRPFDRFAVHRHGVARAIAGAVPRGVVEDREQPRPQVRARLEAIGRAKRLRYVPARDPRRQPAGASAAARSGRGCRPTPAPRPRTPPLCDLFRRPGSWHCAAVRQGVNPCRTGPYSLKLVLPRSDWTV